MLKQWNVFLIEFVKMIRMDCMKNTIVIGHVALIQKSKKQDFTLRLIKKLNDNGYDAIGIFAGECREPDYMEELNQLIEKCDLKEQVVFLGRRDDIPDLLQLIDILIIPSSFEGFPLAGLEAAAAGVPTIACDVAGAKEFIQVSGAGRTFIEDNIENALKAINEIYNDYEKMQTAGIRFANMMTKIKYKNSLRDLFNII